MHATTDVRAEVSISTDKTITVGALAKYCDEKGLGRAQFERIVACLDTHLVEQLCGEKYARGNGDNRYQRAGSDDKPVVTILGESTLSLSYVKDTQAADNEQTYFRPITEVLIFNGQKRYQQCISVEAATVATKTTYRETEAIGDRFTSMPSPATINRRVCEYGPKFQQQQTEATEHRAVQTVIPDGTKVHSQEENAFQNISVTVSRPGVGDSHETTLLDVGVNTSWEKIATTLSDRDAIADDAAVVSDGEEAIKTAFCDGDREHQYDLVHLPRALGHKLREDDQLPLEERNAYASELIGDALHLKNSVAVHAPEDEWDAIRHRIATTEDRLQRTTRHLELDGCWKAATFLRKWQPSILQFAEAALENRQIPWTSNGVERAMGAVSKRCKNKWMRWTERGLEALLNLRLLQYAHPARYEKRAAELIGMPTATAISLEVKSGGTRDKF